MRVLLLRPALFLFGTANALTARRLSSSLICHALYLEEFCYVVYMLFAVCYSKRSFRC